MNNSDLDADHTCSQAKLPKLDPAISVADYQGSSEKKTRIPEKTGLPSSVVSQFPSTSPCIKTTATGNKAYFHVQNTCLQQPTSIKAGSSSEEELLLTGSNIEQLEKHVDTSDVIVKSTLLNCCHSEKTTDIPPNTEDNNTTHVFPVFVAEDKSPNSLSNYGRTSSTSDRTSPSEEHRKVEKADAALNPPADLDSGDGAKSMNILAFCNLLGKLKHLPRTGWLRHKIDHPEPVAGHMYRMAVLAFCLDDHQTSNSGEHKNGSVDKNRCIKLALVHDMAESIVGDITPHCGVSAEEKFRRENEAMQKISTLLPEKVGREMYDLWREYESQSSPEAVLVKQLDKFDLISQAYEYELETKQPKSLQEFFDSTSSSIRSEPILSWAKLLFEEREKCASSNSTNSNSKATSNILRKDNKD